MSDAVSNAPDAPGAPVAPGASSAPETQNPAPAIDLSTLNDAQRRIATTLDEPLFVEAGAGSGKTFTLTQRVAWALCPGSGEGGAPYLHDLGQLLVITFTEAAAREIRERVRSTLRRAHMTEAALAVDDAWISTIHGMCSRILHRHALDLGLDPDFRVVMGPEAAALLDRATDDVLRAARTDDRFRPLFDEYEMGSADVDGSATGVTGLVRTLLSEATGLADGLDGLTPASGGAGSLDEAMDGLLGTFEELGARKLSKAAAAKVGPALEALRTWRDFAPGERTPDAAEAILAQVSVPRSSKDIADVQPYAKSALALARAEAGFVRVAPMADALLDLARRVRTRHTELKRAAGVLTNDDLIREALLAVRDHPEVRADYAGRFRLVMVDEFQDTDPMQLELIGLLAGDGARHLCTVGDAQQSIYRFRGADVGVFYGRGASLDDDHKLRLDVNYRSHADVLALVERVCKGSEDAPGVMAPGAFMHLDASPSRGDAYRARDLPRIDLEVVGGPGRAGYASRDQVQAMADSVADALARYRDHGEKPGDMALLLGVTTHTDAYLDAIRARGMECVVTGGSTFTSTDEVKVMCALLHTLANPADTQSGLFPLLASEMFGLDADDFCALGSKAQEKLDAPTKRAIDRGLWSMELFGGREPSARLAAAREVLTRALDEVAWRPVADVCMQVARDSGWLARLEAAGAAGRARAANVLAAVRYIRDLTESLGLGPARAAVEFDLWLAASKVPPASLAGADDASAGGTVRVMTVHASKGLEFGVVAVAECWGSRSSGGSLAFGELNGRDAFVLRPKEIAGKTPSSVLKEIAPEALEPSADKSLPLPLAARYRAFCDADAEGDAEERARLLYVALTRAREVLVVGVNAARGKEALVSPLAATTLGALGIDSTEPGERRCDYGGSEPARVNVTVVGEDAAEEAEAAAVDEAAVLVADSDDATDDAPASFDLYAVEKPASFESGSWRARDGVFSYSSVHAKLATEAEPASPRPLPTAAERAAEAEGAPATDDADKATNLGSAFHELAQSMVECGREPTEAQINAMVRRWNLSERAERRLCGALARWTASDLRREVLGHALVRAEVPFFQRVEGTDLAEHGDYLEGAIDLLATDPGSSYALVVDYKTGDLGLSEEEVRARHALQAEFYAGVLMREGYESVDCAFICVERDNMVARYSFGA